MSRRVLGMVLAVLAVLFLASGLYQAARDAPTVDEGVDLSSGVTALVRHDVRLNPEHPIFAKAVAALPALLAHPIVPHTKAYKADDWFGYSDDFIRANNNAGKLKRILFLARLIPLLEGLACAALLYALASRLFGPTAGFAAAAIWLTTPVVLGLSHFLMIDVPFTLAALAVSLALLRFLEQPDLRRAAWLAVIVGLSLATRHTALVLLAWAVIVVAYTLRKAERRQLASALAIMVLVPLVTLWLAYRIVAPGGAAPTVRSNFNSLITQAGDTSVVAKVVGVLPAPVEWRGGFAYLVVTSDSRPASLFGQSWVGSRWWYFPGSAVVKLPPGELLLLILGPLGLLALDAERRQKVALTVVAPAVALFGFVLAQPLNLGLRLVLPSVALWLVVASSGVAAAARWWTPSPSPSDAPNSWPLAIGAAVVAGLLALSQVWASVSANPHSLAWTPPPFRPAYRWASDSNLDYGQDLFALNGWSKGKSPWVAFATTRGLGIPPGARRLLSTDGKTAADPSTVTGWVAVGVTPLTVVWQKQLGWLRNYCPVGTIGGSVLLYRFDHPPTGGPAPDQPSPPCFGSAFSQRKH